jgi:transposase
MVGVDTVRASVEELKRAYVIRQAMGKVLRQREAGEVVGLTAHQIRRLIQWVQADGDAGLVQRGRRKPSNRRIPEKVKAKVLTLYTQQYGDFGLTLATEKLAERQRITLSAETLQQWLRARGIAYFTRRKCPHRAWRDRKAHVGEFVQLDGSHYDWLEGRGPRCVLMAYLDDAGSRVFARFYENMKARSPRWTASNGMCGARASHSVYTDKHMTYRV